MTPDDGAGQEVPDFRVAVAKRIAVSVLGLALYALLERLPLPGLSPAVSAFAGQAPLRSGILGVGISLIMPWLRMLGAQPGTPGLPSWTEMVLSLVLVPLLSWPAYFVVSGPRRLADELRGFPEEAVAASAVLRGRLARSTVLLSLGAASLALWVFWQPETAPPMTFIGFAMVVATLLDLVDEARFTARHGKSQSLLSLDDVYRAGHLVRTLADSGIPALPRARRFRSLFFFFYPLVKIDLLVPSDRLAEAWKVVAFEELRDF